MKDIRLISLTFSHFKGLVDYRFRPEGHDVDVYGNNGAFKTTLFDGFSWLLFDKDSRNRAQVEKWIKTLDASGIPIPMVEHSVEGVLHVNGRRISLRKVFKEKWTKKRGASKPDFSGHTTDYYVDGAPVKKAEYENEVASLIDEKTFKLLTNPSFFNEQLDDNERRKLLLEICGDLTDEEVVAGNPKLAELPKLMDGRSLNRFNDSVKADQRRINDILEEIPARIAEHHIAMSGDAISILTTTSELEEVRSRISEKEEQIFRIHSGGEIAAKTNRKRELEGELLQIKNKAQTVKFEQQLAIQQAQSRVKLQIADVELDILRAQNRVKTIVDEIADKRAHISRLRDQWFAADSETWVQVESDTTCPTCGQELPPEQIAAAQQKGVDDFNRSKAMRLEAIEREGVSEKAALERLEEEKSGLDTKLSSLNTELAALKKGLEANRTSASLPSPPDLLADPEYAEKTAEIERLEADIQALRSKTSNALDVVNQELSELRAEAERLSRECAAYYAAEKSRKRVAELKEREKELAKQFEELERRQSLCDEFVRTKVRLLESKINSKFRNVRFRLFETQVNGAVRETCETLYGPNLVPYNGGLNRAAQMNSGLDIIETLSEHYGVKAPIFIDNAEAATELVQISSQQIRLIVPPTFDDLPEEVQNHLAAQHGDIAKAKAAWKKTNAKLRVLINKPDQEATLF